MKKPFKRQCYLCGIEESDYVTIVTHHLLEGRGRRQISDRYGLVVDLCVKCHRLAHHDDITADYLHRQAQKKAEADGMTREQFIYLFGRNYLE